VREQIAKALYYHDHPRGIRRWEDALPFMREDAYNKADTVIQALNGKWKEPRNEFDS
jgi:hypothetical protein